MCLTQYAATPSSVYGMFIPGCMRSVGGHVPDAARNNFIANFNIPSVYGMFIPGCTRSVGIYVSDAAPPDSFTYCSPTTLFGTMSYCPPIMLFEFVQST
jgi:hypothetical protein